VITPLCCTSSTAKHHTAFQYPTLQQVKLKRWSRTTWTKGAVENKESVSQKKNVQKAVEMQTTLTHENAFLSTSTPSADSHPPCNHVDEIKASIHLMSSLLGFVRRVFSAILSVIVAAPLPSLGSFGASADDFTLIRNGGQRQLMIAGGISDPGSELPQANQTEGKKSCQLDLRGFVPQILSTDGFLDSRYDGKFCLWNGKNILIRSNWKLRYRKWWEQVVPFQTKYMKSRLVLPRCTFNIK
jgi:hypothetical protein